MSLGIAFKGPEGIVLASDSRVTLNTEIPSGPNRIILPSTFDNATKLLRFQNHNYVGAVTYGVGAIGQREPRTAHSFLSEFENQLAKNENKRYLVADFAEKLSHFFLKQWTESEMPEGTPENNIIFLIAGFDADAPYGKVFRVMIPSAPSPVEQNAGQFGVSWGGQLAFTNRLVKGMDPRLSQLVQRHLGLNDAQRVSLDEFLERELSLHIPYQFLPLQDCVDLSIFLVRTTMEIQTWLVDIRGVGGAIDVATITRTDGFNPIQQKKIVGQRS